MKSFGVYYEDAQDRGYT